MENSHWKMKVRFVARKYEWDVFSPGATYSAGKVIEFIALKLGLETFLANAVDAFLSVLGETGEGRQGHEHRVASVTSDTWQTFGGTSLWSIWH